MANTEHERLLWVDELCDRFEAAWGTDKQFSIETVLQHISADKVEPALKALLALEQDFRARTDQPFTPTEMRERFPQHPSIVDSLIRNPGINDSLRRDAETIAPQSVDLPNGLRIPQQMGRYRIIRKLGQGAMGSVFLAHDEQLGRKVALKIPRGDVQRDSELRARFEREARAVAALDHPNICRVHDIGEFEGIHYICMGYVEGFSLSRYAIAESGLSEQRIAELILKLAKALAVAHEAGFIHRDLKPANVMIDVNEEPVILDFGLARRANPNEDTRLTQTGANVGSPAYMSPEQVDGDQAKIGVSTDVYGLGVMLYELLTGRLPFEGSVASVMGQIMTREPNKPSEYRCDLSVRLENICLRMMARIPEKRHPSMHAVAAALQEYLDKYAAAPVSSVSESDTVNEDAGAKRRQQIEGLIKSADYAKAENLMVALSRETDESFLEAATWAAAELPVLRKTREEVRAGRQDIYTTASRLMKSHDYEQAKRLLEEYPYDLRTPKMQELLELAEGKVNEVERLQRRIRELRNRGDNAQLVATIDELLELKPNDRRARELREQLTGRSNGPISRLLGPRRPRFMEKASSTAEWLFVVLLVIFASAYPAYQWSADYLASLDESGGPPNPGPPNPGPPNPGPPRIIPSTVFARPDLPDLGHQPLTITTHGVPGPPFLRCLNEIAAGYRFDDEGRPTAVPRPDMKPDDWLAEGLLAHIRVPSGSAGLYFPTLEATQFAMDLDLEINDEGDGIFISLRAEEALNPDLWGRIKIEADKDSDNVNYCLRQFNGGRYTRPPHRQRPAGDVLKLTLLVGNDKQMLYAEGDETAFEAAIPTTRVRPRFQAYSGADIKFHRWVIRALTAEERVRLGLPPSESQVSNDPESISPPGSRSNLVSNGGFESDSVTGRFRSFSPAESVSHWVVKSGTVEVCTTGPFAGRNCLDLDGTSPGTLQQTLATIPGKKYVLRFKARQNGFQRDDNSITVTCGESLQRRIQPSPGEDWSTYELYFTSSAEECDLTFQSNSSADSDSGVMIDDISVVRHADHDLPNKLTEAEGDTICVDLLVEMTPDKVQSSGKWTRTTTGALSVSPGQNTQAVIYRDLPLTYSLELEFRRQSGNESIGITMPIGESASTLFVDAFPYKGGVTGLTRPGHVVFGRKGLLLTNGNLHKLTLHVTAENAADANVIAILDGNEVFSWEGDPRELCEGYALSPVNGLCIGAWTGDCVFEKFELKHAEGAATRAEGRFLRFSGPDSVIVSGYQYTGQYPVTIETVVTPEKLGDEQALAGNAVKFGLGLYMDRSGFISFKAHDSREMCEARSDAPCRVGQRIHVAGSCDGERVRLFVDGKLQRQSAVFRGRHAPGTHFLVGADPDGDGKSLTAVHKKFRGLIHSFRIQKSAQVDNFTPPTQLSPDGSSIVCYVFDGLNDNFAPNLAGDQYLGIVRGAQPTNIKHGK